MTTFNPAAEQIFEKKKGEVLDRPFSASFHDLVFGFSVKEALSKKKAPPFIRVSYTPQNSQLDKLLDIETQFMLGQGVDGLIVTVREMTELNRLELLASRNDRLKT